ncbi:glycosyltransferase [Halorientalis pallida]|uniref:Glycosyltransferase n=1 Tax=Halorientalis pallida TaxID=2479928 RepID=A0A498KXW1_9EURY|nr:glycosyltransferase [Halorientalis pallida]RXK46965.1 glycosyltransferase [Halorientalis pallida]
MNGITFTGVLSVIAVFFGTVWTVTNFYNYYPVVQSAVTTLLTGTRTREAAFVGTDDIGLEEYPEVDVLVPAYREETVIHHALRSVRSADYPHERLTLTVLLEPGDDATREAVESVAADVELDVLTVPSAYPGSPNKPRALNYGFERTDAEIVGVIDAENVVETDLFDRVARAIVGGNRDYVQGIVDMANEDDGWKNLIFRAEYGYWYRFLVPAFKRLGFPIPLSGTTCFFRRSVLEDASTRRRERKGSPWEEGDESWLTEHGFSGVTPWDPDNVTEDFELGLSLWLTDHEFGLVDSVTKEESPQTLDNWIQQRTRWQKGKIFTFVDFLRHPAGSSSDRGHLLWQSFLPHLGPLNITGLVMLVIVGSAIQFVPQFALVVGVLLLSLTFLAVGLGSFGVGYWLASTKSGGARAIRACLVVATVPFYWLLQWGADIRAFKQLYLGDLGWEKTVHRDRGRFESLQHDEETEAESLGHSVKRTLQKHVLLTPILLLALVLRLPNIGRSLWVDEVYSVTVRGSMNVYGIVTTAADPHPPLYYLFLKLWMVLFGRSEVAVRSLSLLFGIGSVGAVYLLAGELYDRRTGLIAALLTGISTFQIQYSQTARMYTMLVFFATLSLYFYVRTLRNHNLDNRFGYATATLLMLSTHVYGSFVLLAQLLHLGTRLVASTDIRAVKKWFGTQVLAGALFVPWMGLVALPNYLFGEGTEVRWLSEPGLLELRSILLAYAGVPTNYPQIKLTPFTLNVGILFGVVLLIAILWQVYLEWRTAERVRGSVLLLSLLVTIIAIPYLVSVSVFPFLETRYTIVGFVAVAIFVAKSITDVDYRPVQVIALVVIVFLFGAMLPSYYTADSAENWDRATSILEDDLDSESLVVFNPGYTSGAVDYYLGENHSADMVQYTSSQAFSRRIAEKQYDQVWVVNIHGENRGAVRRALPRTYQNHRNETVGEIRLTRFGSSATADHVNRLAEGEP